MEPHTAIIATSLIIAVLLGLLYSKRLVPRPSLALAGALILLAAAAYEGYMQTVWAPSVHAPIRLDVFIVDVPLIVVGMVVGLCSTIGRRPPK